MGCFILLFCLSRIQQLLWWEQTQPHDIRQNRQCKIRGKEHLPVPVKWYKANTVDHCSTCYPYQAGEITGPNPPIAWAKIIGSHISSPAADSASTMANRRSNRYPAPGEHTSPSDWSYSPFSSIFSVVSSHRALIIPKEQASRTPRIQAKYHIVCLLSTVRFCCLR